MQAKGSIMKGVMHGFTGIPLSGKQMRNDKSG